MLNLVLCRKLVYFVSNFVLYQRETRDYLGLLFTIRAKSTLKITQEE